MPRYMFIVDYAPQGAKALLQVGGSDRRTTMEKTAGSVGGRLVSFDFALGSNDAYVVVELPDERAAAAVSLTVNGAGAARVHTAQLLSPEDLDAATRVQPDYGAPGSTS
jgi:uncharacterized protein with GYD domain